MNEMAMQNQFVSQGNNSTKRQSDQMRHSRGEWSNQMVETSRTIDQNVVGLNPNLNGNSRKLQNLRKTRYGNNLGKSSETQKSYRGPVLKNGIGLSQNITLGSGIMPHSPQAQTGKMNVQNKFSAHGRDFTPQKTINSTHHASNSAN
jgi:hypothetical protein